MVSRIKIFVCLFLFSSRVFAFQTKAKQAILMDFETGQILFKKNEDEKAFPSSMTKIMTSYLIFEKLENGDIRLSDKIRVSHDAWKQEGSRMFINIGSDVSIDELLKGLIVQSGNDSAYALAEGTSSTIADFVNEMNEKAKEMDMPNTHYTNPIGFSEDGHYMSVKDTAKLSINLMRHFPKYYRQYYAIPEYKYNNILQKNRNVLLGKYEGVDGIKTGHTEAGGYSLAASAFQNGRRLIAVVNGLNSEYSRAYETEKLLNYGFLSLEKYKMFSKGEVVETAKVLYGKPNSVGLIVNRDIYSIARKKDDIKIEINFRDKIKAPITKGEVLGTVSIETKYDTQTFDLVASQDIKRVNIFKRAILWVVYLFK